MDSNTMEIRYQSWYRMIEECCKSNLTKTQWCIENGISPKAFFYRQKKVREMLLAGKKMADDVVDGSNAIVPAFAEIRPYEEVKVNTHKAAAVIQANNVTLEISDDISTDLLKKIWDVISHA